METMLCKSSEVDIWGRSDEESWARFISLGVKFIYDD